MPTPPKKVVTLDKGKPQGALPYVQPGVDPKALGYAAGIAARGGLPKTNTPVAGGPPPPIPALEQPHREGMTMAAQASASRGHDSQRISAQAIQQHLSSGGIIVPEEPQAPAPQGPPQNLPLQAGDILPEEATKDPHFQHGTGSRMAQMQPHMASKYGVIRNGQKLTPQDLASGRGGGPAPNLRGGRPPRSPQDIARDFQQVVQAPPARPRDEDEEESPEPPPGIPRTDEEAVRQADAGPGGAAKHAGQAPIVPGIEEPDEEADKRAKKIVENLDDFDFERLRREMMQDVLKSPRQQEIIEKRLQPMDISELIMKNKIRQRVPIVPGKFEVTFETMSGDLDLKLKQLLIKESKSIAVTEAYILDKHSLMTVAAGTFAINGNPLPAMYDEKGDFNEELFWTKYMWVTKRPLHMLASIGINYSWFEQRVRKLFVADAGKGG